MTKPWRDVVPLDRAIVKASLSSTRRHLLKAAMESHQQAVSRGIMTETVSLAGALEASRRFEQAIDAALEHLGLT